MSDRLRGVAQALNKTYGKKATGSARAIATRDRRIPTGTLSLDYALGGGCPVGRNIMFFGEKSGGKTTSAIRILGIAQGLCRRCLRPAKDVQAIPPPQKVLDEDPDARWSARGICDCYKQGIVNVPDPTHLDFKERAGSKAYQSKLDTWREAMELNSYEEFVCCFIDPEDAFDADWSEKVGADPRRIFFARSSTGEEGVDMVTALVASGGADLIVVDSLAHFTPRKEYEESAEDWQQGLQARIVNKGIRKWVTGGVQTKRSGGEVTQIWINQTRQKIGVMFGDPTVKPAGKGQDFAAHAEIKFLSSKDETIEDQYGSKKETTTLTVSTLFRFKVTKNKTAPTKGVTGEYTMLTRDTDVAVAGTVVEDEYVFKLAMHYLVEKKGTTYHLGELEFTSQKSILEALREDKELFAATKAVLLARMLKGTKT